jgi:NAD(P)H dehydrogenase (quinone)
MRPFLLILAFSLFSFLSLSAQESPQVLIAFYSPSGSTQALARAIADGAGSVSGIEVKLRSIDQITPEDVTEASAVIVGSPVYNAQVAPPVQEFINSWPFEGRPMKNKIGAAFATGGGISIGEEVVMLSILQSMLIHGMIVVGGEETEAAFGASAITGEGPFEKVELDEIFLKKGYGLGKRVASLTRELADL